MRVHEVFRLFRATDEFYLFKTNNLFFSNYCPNFVNFVYTVIVIITVI